MVRLDRLVPLLLHHAIERIGRQEATAAHRADISHGAKALLRSGAAQPSVDRLADDRADGRAASLRLGEEAAALVAADQDLQALGSVFTAVSKTTWNLS